MPRSPWCWCSWPIRTETPLAGSSAIPPKLSVATRVTVPEGALSDRRKEGLVKEATATVLDAAGLSEADALRVWVLVHEQREGTWGAGGTIIRFAELAALAKAERENA